MLCTWSIFPFFPVIPACDGEDKEIWSLQRFFDEFCPKFSSKTCALLYDPPRCRFPIYCIDLAFQHCHFAADRGRFSPACTSVGASGAACPSVLSAHRQQHARPTHPSTSVTRLEGPSAWCPTLLPPLFLIFFPALSLVKLLSALHTGFKWLCREAQMGPSHSLSFQKLPGSCLPSQLAFIGSRHFLSKCFFSLECLLQHLLNISSIGKAWFCFASLCFVLQLHLEWA